MKTILLYLTIMAVGYIDCIGFNNQLGGLPPLPPLKNELFKVTKVKKKVDIAKQRKEIEETMKQVHSIKDFLTKFKSEKGLKVHLSGDGEMARLIVQRSGFVDKDYIPYAVPGTCEPRPKEKSLSSLSYELNAALYPNCIVYHQCGGCCHNNDIEECVPVSYNKHTVNLFAVSYKDATFNMEPYTYMNHTSCRCECKVKEEHCTKTQVYDEGNCQCTCPKSATKECPKNKQWTEHECDCVCTNPHTGCVDSKKKWDKDICDCVCEVKESCGFGNTWDEASCHCMVDNYNNNNQLG